MSQAKINSLSIHAEDIKRQNRQRLVLYFTEEVTMQKGLFNLMGPLRDLLRDRAEGLTLKQREFHIQQQQMEARDKRLKCNDFSRDSKVPTPAKQ